MKLPSKGVLILLTVILLLAGMIAYGSFWFVGNYTLMAIPKKDVVNVEVCRDNYVSCSLLYTSKDEIPVE